jgi:hypothetical protein
MLMKVGLSKLHNKASVFAVIVAALGALYRRANSPNASPGWYSLRNLGSSPVFYRVNSKVYHNSYAGKRSSINDEKIVSLIALLNDDVSCSEFLFLHSSYDYLKLFSVQSVKDKRGLQLGLNPIKSDNVYTYSFALHSLV